MSSVVHSAPRTKMSTTTRMIAAADTPQYAYSRTSDEPAPAMTSTYATYGTEAATGVRTIRTRDSIGVDGAHLPLSGVQV